MILIGASHSAATPRTEDSSYRTLPKATTSFSPGPAA
jgi:hypothetical protein